MIKNDVETWKCNYPEEGCGIYDSCIRAESTIIDDGVKKYVQISLNDEVSSFSVSTYSLHEYDSVNSDCGWTIDSCDECLLCQQTDLEDGDANMLHWLLNESKTSQYYSYYSFLADVLKSTFPNVYLHDFK